MSQTNKTESTEDIQIDPAVSDLIDKLHNRYPEVSFAKLCRIVVATIKWHKEQIK